MTVRGETEDLRQSKAQEEGLKTVGTPDRCLGACGLRLDGVRGPDVHMRGGA